MVMILLNYQQKLISMQPAGSPAPNQVCKIAVPQAAPIYSPVLWHWPWGHVKMMKDPKPISFLYSFQLREKLD
jgi:hypothetical protein